MSHYEQRLENDLNQIKTQVGQAAVKVEQAVRDSVQALLQQDTKLANKVSLGDKPINRMIRGIDKLCHSFIARHLPSAGHLRLISSVMRVNIALERIGDYAVTIARVAAQLKDSYPDSVKLDIEYMATQSLRMLTESITAFSDNNAGVAHSTMHIADDVENELTKALRNLINASSQHTNDVATLFNLFSVLSKIERVSDQAKNICEEAIFAATGATKEEKVYRILFLDQHNNCQSQIAKAIGNKLFPHSGKYFSAGNKSLPTDPLLTSFLDKHGLDSAVDQPSSEVSNLKLADFHVIVSLQGAISDYISDIPFHTATLEWDVGTADQPSHDRFETIYRSITHELRDLMETLRGEGAN